MPMIIGLYIGIPLLAKIVKSFSFKVICPIMLAIFIFEYIEPMLNVFVRIFNFKETFYSDMNIPYMGAAYGLYLLIGYYIYNNKLRIKKELLICKLFFLIYYNLVLSLCFLHILYSNKTLFFFLHFFCLLPTSLYYNFWLICLDFDFKFLNFKSIKYAK